MVTFLELLFPQKHPYVCLINVLITMNLLQGGAVHGLNNSISSMKLGDNCEVLLEQYATITANFTRCVIRHARPIRICQKCIQEYVAVEKSHDDILKLHEKSGETCQTELLNVDRLDLIEASFKFVKDLWKKADCNKCFVSGPNSTEVNFNTLRMFKLYNETEKCLTESAKRNSTTICNDCKSGYSSLNDFYIQGGSDVGFCMDVIDMINSTRYEWSKKYNCSITREKTEWLFFTSSAIICMLPVIFYSIIWFFSTFSFPEVSTQTRWQRRFRRLSNSSR